MGQTNTGKTMIASHFFALWWYWQIWHLWPHFPSFRFPFQELQEQWLSRTKHAPTPLPVFHVDVCMLCSRSLPLLLNTISFLLGKCKINSEKALEVAYKRCKMQVLCIGCGGRICFCWNLCWNLTFWSDSWCLYWYNMCINVWRSTGWTSLFMPQMRVSV